MCLAIAGKIVAIEEQQARIDFGGLEKQASTLLFPNLAVGDHVLIHAGFVIQVLEEDYAMELMALAKEIGLDEYQ